MTTEKRRTRFKLVSEKARITGCALSATMLAVVACGDDESENNDSCETDCVAEYAKDAQTCEEETTSCMADCTGPDDTSCMWDCEDFEMECSTSFVVCVGRCPCAKKLVSCSQDCRTGERTRREPGRSVR